MEAAQLVVRKQALGTAPLGDGQHALLLVLHRNALEDRRNAVAHTHIQPNVTELPDGPPLQCLYHVRVRHHSEDGGMLSAKGEDGHALRAAPDLAPEGVECTDGGGALHGGQREAPDGEGADGDAVDDVHEVFVNVRGVLERS